MLAWAIADAAAIAVRERGLVQQLDGRQHNETGGRTVWHELGRARID
jgi:hypothetical protein